MICVQYIVYSCRCCEDLYSCMISLTLTLCSVIYNINTAMCIGIVSATQYCQYACGRQPGKYPPSIAFVLPLPYLVLSYR